MVKYVTAALALLATLIVDKAAGIGPGSGGAPIGGYQPYTNVNTDLAKDVEQETFEGIVDPSRFCFTDDTQTTPLGCTTLADIQFGKAYYFDGDYNSFNNLRYLSQDIMTGTSPVFTKFKAYYGSNFNPNDWVIKALDAAGSSTCCQTTFDNGNADFNILGDLTNPTTPPGVDRRGKAESEFAGFEESAKTASAYVTVKLIVFEKLQEAIDLVNRGCFPASECDLAVHAWDQAVAYYTGSLDRDDSATVNIGESYGTFPRALADKRCDDYLTCGPPNCNPVPNTLADRTNTAYVNTRIIPLFQQGAAEIASGNAAAAAVTVGKIETVSIIPYVQGYLRKAHERDLTLQGNNFDKEMAEGAAFAFGVLPHIHACCPHNAQIIWANMRVGGGAPDYYAVRRATEESFQCLGITCSDIGGLWDEDEITWYQNAQPCNDGSSTCPGATFPEVSRGGCSSKAMKKSKTKKEGKTIRA